MTKMSQARKVALMSHIRRDEAPIIQLVTMSERERKARMALREIVKGIKCGSDDDTIVAAAKAIL
jgi:hypothetical protein